MKLSTAKSWEESQKSKADTKAFKADQKMSLILSCSGRGPRRQPSSRSSEHEKSLSTLNLNLAFQAGPSVSCKI